MLVQVGGSGHRGGGKMGMELSARFAPMRCAGSLEGGRVEVGRKRAVMMELGTLIVRTAGNAHGGASAAFRAPARPITPDERAQKQEATQAVCRWRGCGGFFFFFLSFLTQCL